MGRKWGESKLTLSYWKKQSELTQSLTELEIENLAENRERNRKSDQPFIGQQSLLISSENTLLIKNSKLNMNLSWQSYEREASYTAGSVNYDIRYTTNPARRSGVIAGTQGYFQAKDYKAYISIYQNRVLSNSLYVLYRYDIEKLNVLAGVRYDHKKVTTPVEALDKDYQFINGSAGVAFHPLDKLTFKINTASGNSIPAEERYFSNHLYYGYLYAYDTKEMRNYEGDIEAEWDHPSITINVNGFYNRIYNYSYVDTFDLLSVGTGDHYILKQGDANITGGEAKLVIHPQTLKWLNLRIGYSIVRGKFEDSDANLPLMPADKLTAAIRFQSDQMKSMYSPYIDVIFRNYMKQERVFHEMPTDAYSLIDLHVGGSFKWGRQLFDISIAANNILDKDFYSHLSMLKNLAPEPVRDMGRNVAIILRFPFGIKH